MAERRSMRRFVLSGPPGGPIRPAHAGPRLLARQGNARIPGADPNHPFRFRLRLSHEQLAE
ncbi:MAG: hypothetical protein C0504_17235 [Candidatus Solibacter sp.]|nr:hypothetical protein [Candidatus Solibacter sp.]